MLNRLLYPIFFVMLFACNNANNQKNAEKQQESTGAAIENN